MGNDKKRNLSEEHLKEFRHRVNYVINETPKYRSLMGSNEEFDEVPVMTNEVGEQEDARKPVPQPPVEPSNDQPIGDAPIPAFDEPQGDLPPEGDLPAGQPPVEPEVTGDLPAGEPPMGDTQTAMGMPPESPENQVDDLQNEIIKHNISAMRSIHDQLAGLSKNIDTMNIKMEELNADVQEVREPSDSEKLMNKTEVSYPYYFNLNDFWQDNWFDQQRKAGNEKGIKKLPDGTYVADFDDLPLKSNTDIDNSFNDLI